MSDDHETITVPVEIPLDDVHRPAFESLVASEPTREAALETIGEALSEAADGRSIIYQLSRRAEQQREQIAQQMQAAETDDG